MFKNTKKRENVLAVNFFVVLQFLEPVTSQLTVIIALLVSRKDTTSLKDFAVCFPKSMSQVRKHMVHLGQISADLEAHSG